MSYTIVRDEAAELDRLEVNLDNIIRRRCKIGNVRMTTDAAPSNSMSFALIASSQGQRRGQL